MNELVLVNRAADWAQTEDAGAGRCLFPITRRVYNLGLHEFFEWFGREPGRIR